jgi:hypothetical protein
VTPKLIRNFGDVTDDLSELSWSAWDGRYCERSKKVISGRGLMMRTVHDVRSLESA